MELRHLRCFVTVVREGNFTRAAERLRIAQPPLSRQIPRLEAGLDVTLLERRSRPLRPTVVGRLFYEHALHLLDRIEVLTITTERVGRLERDRFGIGFVGSTLHDALPDLVRRSRAAYPELWEELSELASLQQVAALTQGTRLAVDEPVGFLLSRRLGEELLERHGAPFSAPLRPPAPPPRSAARTGARCPRGTGSRCPG